MSHDPSKPNHYLYDSLGDPLTCTGDHNHPGADDEPAVNDRIRRERAHPVSRLRKSLECHDEWPTRETAAVVIDDARRIIDAIDMQAEKIAYHRQHVTPTEEAMRALLGDPER